jgi:hypothetical protein
VRASIRFTTGVDDERLLEVLGREDLAAGGKAVMVWDVDVIEDVVLLELAIAARV